MATPKRARAKRASPEEKEQRIDLATKLLLLCKPKHEIKKAFASRFGIVARQTERYISLARERLIDDAEADVDTMRAESFAFYRRLLADDTVEPKDKIKARERMDKLYGLDKPVKIAPTNVEGTEEFGMSIAAQLMSLAEPAVEYLDDAAIEAESMRLIEADAIEPPTPEEEGDA